ncbi:DUF1735 domain-containing protein [Mucilaginibacter sp.]|uniref:DUF1735 domain-containing protein n=1 Tax=Mucilaginibacter sp. TaxID=1882438 RepID=UPI002634EF32|nr:DUF1735 domain-containing protein [Mucilaginibacter sp.]MDB4927505.1 hypothetical protein [Mucilaginibacter sp.]
MKKLFYIKLASASLMLATVFSSCLKDDGRSIDFASNKPVVDFALTANAKQLTTATISGTAATSSLNAQIVASAPRDLTSPTAVTVIVDQAAMTTKYGTTYTLLPASVYTIAGSLTVNIVPGIVERVAPVLPIVGTPVTLPTSLGYVSFTVNGPALKTLQTANPTVTYMLPLTISSATGNDAIVDQFKTLFFKIVVGP